MKIYILTEGGKDIGFGHITRCISLSQAFEEKGIASEFIVNEDDSILGVLRGKNYRIFNWFKEKNKLFEIVGNADIVIIDSYLAKKSLYDRVSKICRGRIVVIDDYNRLEYAKGVVVNPSIYGDSLKYPLKGDIIYLLGKDYVILRKEFWAIPEKEINKEIKNVLITFGGRGYFDVAHSIINYLKDKFNFNFFTVNPKKNRLSAKQMLDLMLKADLCISAGGQTTYELARVGVPAAGVCFAANQRLNLEGWQKVGFMEYAGWWEDQALPDKISACIERLQDRPARQRRSTIGRKFVDGEGSSRICNALLELSYGRKENYEIAKA